MKTHLYILSLSCWAAGVLLRKYLIIPISSRVFPAPSCTNFRVLDLLLRSFIHFELILVQGYRHGSRFNFLQTDNHFSKQNFLKRLGFLHHMFFVNFVKKWGEYSCVDSYPHLLFCYTGLQVCFCASAMLFSLLLFCDIIWSWVLWYHHHCSFCWVLPWLFAVSCVSKWISWQIFNLCDESHWDFY
jgi:hypothetical protein